MIGKTRALAGLTLSFCLGLTTVKATPILVDFNRMPGDDIITNQLVLDDMTLFDLGVEFPPDRLVANLRGGQFEALRTIVESPELFHMQMSYGASGQSFSSLVYSQEAWVSERTVVLEDWAPALSLALLVATVFWLCWAHTLALISDTVAQHNQGYDCGKGYRNLVTEGPD